MRQQIVFICMGNSCRSIMAEALTRHLCPERWEAASAGTRPLGYITPETLQVLAEIGVSTRGLSSKGLHQINWQKQRVVVNLSGYSLVLRLPREFSGMLLDWQVDDPYGLGLETYRQTRDILRGRILTEIVPWSGLA